jgi:hypothetical protein
MYTLEVSEDGNYDIDLRVSSISGGGWVRLDVVGQNGSEPIVVPKTGDWQRYATVTLKGVRLGKGRQRIRVLFMRGVPEDGGHVCNFNWLRITPSLPPN